MTTKEKQELLLEIAVNKVQDAIDAAYKAGYEVGYRTGIEEGRQSEFSEWTGLKALEGK